MWVLSPTLDCQVQQMVLEKELLKISVVFKLFTWGTKQEVLLTCQQQIQLEGKGAKKRMLSERGVQLPFCYQTRAQKAATTVHNRSTRCMKSP